VIRVYRSLIDAPDELTSNHARVVLKELAALTPKSRRQKSAPAIYGDQQVRAALLTVFHRKCAYCESPVDPASMLVDHFRPKANAVNQDGSVSADAYWWLIYEWENLYAACSSCSHLKASRFPVEGARAGYPATGQALLEERPLLLDPCIDDPDAHLVFSEDGRVASDSERGRVTINVLGLNRDTLVSGRQAAIATLRNEFSPRAISKRKPHTRHVLLSRLAGASAPFAGARRQLLARLVAEEAPELSADLTGIRHVTIRVRDAAQIKQATHDFDAQQRAQESYSIEDESRKAHYFARTRAIDRIEIRNFRPIGHLKLRFPDPVRDRDSPTPTDWPAGPDRTPQTPWLMLLGENASGKSSVLQAVALALIGDEWRKRLKLEPWRYVKQGKKSGYVKVYLVGVKDPITLRFSIASNAFTSEPSEPKVLLLGYGSTRLLPRHGARPKADYDFARIDNLLNPYEPLNDAGGWLATLDDPTFDTVALALRPILDLKGEDALVRKPSGIPEARLLGARVVLDELSDGYQSVVALATDIMRVMLKRWNALEIAEGIVVLDEIGSHLHPAWRIRIVTALRKAFPRVQFLVSTHDPLCLRGLNADEVVVMKRDMAKRVVAVTDLPSFAGLRIDQLLTSEYFGLSNTMEPHLEATFAEYYRLRAVTSPTVAQRVRLQKLKDELDRHQVLGANQRERLMLEAIDQFIAEEKASATPASPRRRAATRKKLEKIWDRTPAAIRPPGGSRL
jgi:uncharacterized protein (TIGR02646 family)